MTTPKLALPELVVGQAGKELTHNQALAVLDQLAQAVVVDKDLATPPVSPANGAMYIVAAGATGAWSGQSGKLAYWLTSVGAWTFATPVNGWSVWVTDESERYELKAGAWTIASSGGSTGDMLSDLSSSEILITGATTLTSTAFGKMHVCYGTTSDYTISLPAASGNAGKIIGIRSSQGLTKVVSIYGSGSETIDGKLYEIITSSCSLVFLCDGTAWSVVIKKVKPVFFSAYQSTAQTIPNSTIFTKINLNAEASDTHSYFDTSTSRFNPKVSGRYIVTGGVVYQPHTSAEAGKILVLSLYKNGTRFANFAVSAFTSSTSSGATGSCIVDLDGNLDYIELFTAQGGTAALDLQANQATTFMQSMLLSEI